MVRSLSLIGLLLAVLPLHAEPLPLAILLDDLDGSAVARVGQAEQDVLAAQRSQRDHRLPIERLRLPRHTGG